MTALALPVSWQLRPVPLTPVAVLAHDTVARALADRMLARSDAELAALTGVTAGRWLIVLGETESLPWTDGVAYLGRDPEAPNLLLSTLYAPAVPIALLERAVRAQFPDLALPLVLLSIEPYLVVSLSTARSIERIRLRAFMERM